MKLMMVNSVCGPGSTGRIVADIGNRMLADGHDVLIAYGIGSGSGIDPQYTFRMNNRAGYLVHNALSRLTDHAGRYSRFQTQALVRKIREFDPDILHLHQLHGFYLHYGVLFDFLKKWDKPVVWTLHDFWAMTGHCAIPETPDCPQWADGCKNCPGMKLYPSCLLGGDSVRNFERKRKAFTSVKNMTLVTPSKWAAGLVKQSFLSKYPVHPIYNGIDLGIFHPIQTDWKARHGLEGKQMLLAVANVWDERKGWSDLMTMLPQLRADQKLVMVGVTPAQKAQLPDSVLAIERTENVQALAEIYAAADVFVNTSHFETMGMVTAEALACGTPVATYDATAVPEIADAKSGVSVPDGDTAALLSAIDRAAAFDRADCARRGAEFDLHQAFMGQTLRLYHDITGGMLSR